MHGGDISGEVGCTGSWLAAATASCGRQLPAEIEGGIGWGRRGIGGVP